MERDAHQLPGFDKRFVTATSSRLGSGLPDGWLCATRADPALRGRSRRDVEMRLTPDERAAQSPSLAPRVLVRAGLAC